MAYVSSSGFAAPVSGARTGKITRLLAQVRAVWSAHRAAAEERRALAEVLSMSCPGDRRRLIEEYDIAATRQAG